MRQYTLFGCVVLGLAALCVPAAMHMPVRLVYNASDSVARGWYGVERADSLHVGSIVLARLPANAALLAAQRDYLPHGVPILKQIGAAASQWVCVHEQAVRIDGAVTAMVLTHDARRRPLSVWRQCRPLADGELFLLGDTNPASFDSRYFGPIPAADVLGVARPLWTWSTP